MNVKTIAEGVMPIALAALGGYLLRLHLDLVKDYKKMQNLAKQMEHIDEMNKTEETQLHIDCLVYGWDKLTSNEKKSFIHEYFENPQS